MKQIFNHTGKMVNNTFILIAIMLSFCIGCRNNAEIPEPIETPQDAYKLPVKKEVVLLACGDALLTRLPGKKIEQFGFKHPFGSVQEKISQADISFINLECPVSFIGKPYPGKPPNVTFRASPGVVFSLKWAGFDVVSLANNHMTDYGQESVKETLEYLDLAGIQHCGAGINNYDSRKPVFINRQNVRFAFLAYAEPIWSVVAAGESDPGVAHAVIEDMIEDIRKAAVQADHVFVSIHWGDEFQHIPNEKQIYLGRTIIDAGATAVLGHHPHVLQSIEKYNNGFILYSMGNFVFDMNPDDTYQSAFFRFYFSGIKLERLELEPVIIDKKNFNPRLANENESAKTLDNIKSWSQGFKTDITIYQNKGIINN